jgi:hypothetical protein
MNLMPLAHLHEIRLRKMQTRSQSQSAESKSLSQSRPARLIGTGRHSGQNNRSVHQRIGELMEKLIAGSH